MDKIKYSNYKAPIFIHVCFQMYLQNRDEYGNLSLSWEPCDEYRALSCVTWFKRVEYNGKSYFSFSTNNNNFGYLSDDLQLFETIIDRSS